jgi:hypothetical protein
VATPTVRRFYARQRRLATLGGDTALAGIWRAKQEAIAWPDLPAGFPSRALLLAAGFPTVRDLDGADERELTDLGLTARAAAAVLAAMESWTMIATVTNNYTRQDGRFASTYDAPLHPSASRAATGTGDVYEMGDMSCLRLELDVTVITGTLDVLVQTSHNGVDDWRTVGTAFTQATGVTSQRLALAGTDRYVRVSYTIVTGPATFSVTGEAC